MGIDELAEYISEAKRKVRYAEQIMKLRQSDGERTTEQKERAKKRKEKEAEKPSEPTAQSVSTSTYHAPIAQSGNGVT